MEHKYYTRQGQRYVEVSPGARYESEIQHLVSQNASAIFPDYAALLLDPLFSTPAGDVQPDLVLVRTDGAGWGLVEVELEGHSFKGHVLPQLSKLTYAEAYPALADKLARELPYPAEQVIRTALTHRPTVFLVIHGSSERQQNNLTKLGVEVRDIDVLQAPDKPNDYMLVVKDRTIRRRALHSQALRSTSPLTRTIWSVTNIGLIDLLTQDLKLEVEVLGTRAFWKATVENDGLLLRQPTDLSSEYADIDSMTKADLFVDDEHKTLYFEPTGGK